MAPNSSDAIIYYLLNFDFAVELKKMTQNDNGPGLGPLLLGAIVLIGMKYEL